MVINYYCSCPPLQYIYLVLFSASLFYLFIIIFIFCLVVVGRWQQDKNGKDEQFVAAANRCTRLVHPLVQVYHAGTSAGTGVRGRGGGVQLKATLLKNLSAILL